MPLKHVQLALTVLAVPTLSLAACGRSATNPSLSPSPSPSPTCASGIDGIVLFAGGPYLASPSPSSLPGGFGSGAQGRPYRFVTVDVRATSGTNAGRVVATVKPDAQALFSLDLPPSGYVLRCLVPSDGPGPNPRTLRSASIGARGPSSMWKVRRKRARASSHYRSAEAGPIPAVRPLPAVSKVRESSWDGSGAEHVRHGCTHSSWWTP